MYFHKEQVIPHPKAKSPRCLCNPPISSGYTNLQKYPGIIRYSKPKTTKKNYYVLKVLIVQGFFKRDAGNKTFNTQSKTASGFNEQIGALE